MKAIWTGSISFGLVSIGVQLFSAIKEHVIGFTLLCAKCHTPIQYDRWCRHCNKEVKWQDVEKGLKLPDGTYFILTKEKLHSLKSVKTDTIDIQEFVDASEIKPLYLENHYYVGPTKATEKAFALFHEALNAAGKVAIAKFVMREKEYVCAIMPYENILLLSTLHYAYEIRPISMIAETPKKISAGKAELSLAEELVSKLTHKKFNLAAYHDTFVQRLLAEIKKSKTGKKLPSKPAKIARPKKDEKETALLSRLKASLSSPSTKGKKK